MRPDIHFTDETKQKLLRLLKNKQKAGFPKKDITLTNLPF